MFADVKVSLLVLDVLGCDVSLVDLDVKLLDACWMPLLVRYDDVVDALETILFHIEVLHDGSIRGLDAILDIANLVDASLRDDANVLDANDVVDVGHFGSTNPLDVPILLLFLILFFFPFFIIDVVDRTEVLCARLSNGVVVNPMFSHKLSILCLCNLVRYAMLMLMTFSIIALM